jgi:hypothetical protein
VTKSGGSTGEGTYSDAKGRFEFPRHVKTGDVLVFSFIGRKTIEFVVPDQPMALLEMVMEPDSIQMVECALVEGEEFAGAGFFGKRWRKAKGSH